MHRDKERELLPATERGARQALKNSGSNATRGQRKDRGKSHTCVLSKGRMIACTVTTPKERPDIYSRTGREGGGDSGTSPFYGVICQVGASRDPPGGRV